MTERFFKSVSFVMKINEQFFVKQVVVFSREKSGEFDFVTRLSVSYRVDLGAD